MLAFLIPLLFPIAAWTRPTEVTFGPRHIFSELEGDGELQTSFTIADHHDTDGAPTWTLRTVPTTVSRPKNPEVYQEARMRSMKHAQTALIEWEDITVHGPDVQNQHTLSQLARMTGNAYSLPGRKSWYDIDPTWNISFPFGWEDSEDGFRGHIFVTPDNSTVVLAIKGTTINGRTSKKDKFNDNLLFSCCCARVDPTWVFRTVCNCYSGHWTCDSTCLSDALIADSLFYNTGVGLVTNVSAMYPGSNIWLVGHSLGGALASLLGTTFGLPAVAFESPGEKLAAHRLHLPTPLRGAPVTHVYHNADPIPLGACTGPLSPCAQAGYALESRCHLGKSIVYDTVGELGWRVDVTKHPIREVILKVIEDGREWELGRKVPEAREEEECVDCFKWEFL